MEHIDRSIMKAEVSTAYESYEQQISRLAHEVLGSIAKRAEVSSAKVHDIPLISKVSPYTEDAFTTASEDAFEMNCFWSMRTRTTAPVSENDEVYFIHSFNDLSMPDRLNGMVDPFDYSTQLLSSSLTCLNYFTAMTIDPGWSLALLRMKKILKSLVKDCGTQEWTDEKNERRCALVDKEIDGTLTVSEQAELEKLQAEMLAYRRKVAPRPIEAARKIHQVLLKKSADKND